MLLTSCTEHDVYDADIKTIQIQYMCKFKERKGYKMVIQVVQNYNYMSSLCF